MSTPDSPAPSYVAFARKYRPRSFGEVVGQEAIARALRTAVASGRTATVYLFSGSHGVGKTSMARILSKALNCPRASQGDPCLECEVCLSIDRGEALDVMEIDAASNRSVEDAERIRQDVRYKPQGGGFKVYILDEVHQLSRQAFDALLKTFEEAPAHVRFILATTELHKVPTTIRSRAQVFAFRRSGLEALEERLTHIAAAEGVTVTPAAVRLVARRARGSMRDAQKLLDQVVGLAPAAGDGAPARVDAPDVARLLGALTDERVLAVLAALVAGDAGALLSEVAAHAAEGGRSAAFLEELVEALRAVLYLQAAGPESPLLDEVAWEPEQLRPTAEALSQEAVLYALQLLEEASQRLRTAREPRVVVEVCLVRLARARELRPIGEVLARLERLEELLSGGAPGPGPGAPAPSSSPAAPPPASGAGPGRGPAAAPGEPRAPQRGGEGRRSYDYPGKGSLPAASPVPPPAPPAQAPAEARAPSQAPAEARVPSEARAAVELERSARLDGPTPPAATAAPLDAGRLSEAWQAASPRLAEALGITWTGLTRAEPRLRLEQGEVRIELSRTSDLVWNKLQEAEVNATVARHLGEALGEPARVRFARLAAPEPAAGAGAAASRTRSVYEEEIVKVAQRELGAQPLQAEPGGPSRRA